MIRTPLSPRAVARVLAGILARAMAGSASGRVASFPFGDAVAVVVGDACLCTVSDADGGVDLEWAPHSDEARSMLLPLLDAALGA